MEEKLRWTFSLYDINGDGYITREEMTDIATAVYELMGRSPESSGPDPDKIKDKVERVFTVSGFLLFNLFSFLLSKNLVRRRQKAAIHQENVNVSYFECPGIFLTF